MRTKQVVVRLESGDVAGHEPFVLVGELVLYPDGSVTGSAVLAGGGGELALAATGTHDDVLVPAVKVVKR